MTLAINAGFPLTDPQGRLTSTGLPLLLPATTASAAQITPGHVAVWVDRSTLADGGIPASGGTVTHTAGALTANQVVIGNGAADIKVLGTLGTTVTVLHGNAAGAPTFGAVALGTDVSGDLPFANLTPATAASRLLGRGSAAGAGDFQELTLGSNLTLTGTVLNASSGTGTVTNTGTLTNHALIKGNGGVDVSALASLGTTTTVLHGNASGDPSFGAVDLAADVTGNLGVTHLNSGTSASSSTFWRGDGTWGVPAGSAPTSTLGLTIDGAGSVLTTGTKGFLYVPRACTITAVTILSTDAAVTSGSIVVDLWKSAYSAYPPTVANTITAAALPTITSTIKSQDTTLTGWTTSISAGDVLAFHINSVSSFTRVTLQLTIT